MEKHIETDDLIDLGAFTAETKGSQLKKDDDPIVGGFQNATMLTED